MHKLLQRQLKRFFGSSERVPGELEAYVRAVDEAYEQADADRKLLERSLDLTSDELLEANAELRRDREELERRVSGRTAELVAANRTLEREIGVRRAAEQRLRASEQRFQTLAENSPTGIFHADAAGRTVYVNKAWCEITGMAAGKALGHGWQSAIHPDDRRRNVTDWRRAVEAGSRLEGSEYRIQRPDGEVFWVVGQAVALTDGDGAVAGYVGTMTDITLRRVAEEAIRRSEEKYRALFEESHDTIYIATPQGQLLDINPAGVRMFGYATKAEMLQVDLASHVYLRTEDRTRMLQALTLRGYVRDLELEVQRRGGERRTVLATASAERDSSGRVIAVRGLLRDVTGQRNLERQLRQAQKMEAIGRLAGGVAHDFNNLLTAIIGYADLLAMATDDDSPLRHNTDEIKAAAKRGADLTRQLLAFGRRQHMTPETLDLNTRVSHLEKLLGRVIGEDIELVTRLEPRLGAVKVDPSQIEQVILNLGINARDAMPDGGRLTLRTANVDLEGESATDRHPALEAGAYVLLEVQDNGSGIDESIREQIFEPFFTTKERGKGSGLGLSTVYGIVRQSGGHIEVESAANRGTTFRIYLPRVEQRPAPGVETEPATGLPGGSETILLVEDEPSVRAFLAGLLERLGYHVLTADDGQEALEIARASDRPIDLLLSDVVMPRMGGVELAREFLRRRLGLRVLLISGYTERPESLHDGHAGEALDFLQKPFSSSTLARRLRELLRRDRQSVA